MKLTKARLHAIIKEEYDRFTEEEGLAASHQTSNPELDQVADISNSVIETGGSLLDIAGALKAQGFTVTLMHGVLVVDSGSEQYFVGKPEKFEIESDDDVVEAGEFVVGLMGN